MIAVATFAPLNSQIIEIVGRGDAQYADQEELAAVPGWKAQTLDRPRRSLRMGSSTRKENGGAALGKNQGIDGSDGVEAGKAAGEGGAAEGGGDSPEERGGGNVG